MNVSHSQSPTPSDSQAQSSVTFMGKTTTSFRDANGITHLGLTMKLKEGQTHIAEYQRRHDELWAELRDALHEATIFDYIIFVDDTGMLFASLKYRDEDRFATLREKPIMKKWWSYMRDLMHTEADNSPQTIMLTPTFYFPGDGTG